MIVCLKDVDKVNPQIYPIYLRDDLLANKIFVRPEQTPRYIANPESDILPTAPQNLRLEGAPLSNYIYLYWDGPADYGSSPILGYNIYRATPQLAVYEFIQLDSTGSAYIDVSSDVTVEYTYYVTAVSMVGESPASNVAFWPTQTVPDTINYLVTSNTESVITTGSGDYIIL